MAHHRALLLAVVFTLCLCAAGSGATALGAPTTRGHADRETARHNALAHHRLACAIPSSFHARAGHHPHIRRSARCLKRRAEAHRRALLHRRAEARRRALLRQASKPYALTRRIPSASAPAVVNSNCPDTTLEPNRQNIERIRTAVLCLVNRERSARGERPLVADLRLTASAQAHSNSMSEQDYFEHVGPHGETLLMRMRATGYLSSAHGGYEVGENIGWGTLWKGTPRAVVAAWMGSPGHRANILDSRFTATGVGVSPRPPACVAGGQAGGLYTQDFGSIGGG